ncbi:MAG: serine/threonine protein kinase [Bacteroidales bacterium]|nr:serine/threonine protein kinase [Bacteroidales bacterium]
MNDVIGMTALGRYQILRFLGAGSNADVFLARPTTPPHTPVVVKRIKPHITQTPRFRQFFDNEVRSMQSFQHPNVVQFWDASLDDPLGPCLVLEYLQGKTLEELLTQFRRFPPDFVGLILGPLCHALQAAQTAHIVHRDLKPANLMILNPGQPNMTLKVMDFGFAGFTSKPHIQLADLTGRGQIFACGTPAYVSPEMIRGDAVDSRGDLYGVGVILYEMLTSHLPFEYDAQDMLLSAHVHEPPPPFASWGVRDVPTEVETAVLMALAKFPNERPQSFRQLAEFYGRAIGMDIWAESAPVNYTPPAPQEEIVECVLAVESTLEDRFVFSDRFEAMMPERLATAKLKGFIDDTGAEAVESEPGLVRVRVGMPARYEPQQPQSRSAILGWISAMRRPTIPRGQEPIEIILTLNKIDANRVTVLVAFRPLKDFMPDDLRTWQARCETLNATLRRYLMAVN